MKHSETVVVDLCRRLLARMARRRLCPVRARLDAMRIAALPLALLSLATACLFAQGCGKWKQSNEALVTRKSVLAWHLSESDRKAIPDDFFAYAGFWDWYRMPLVYPYQAVAIDLTDHFCSIERYDGKGSIRDPNRSMESIVFKDKAKTAHLGDITNMSLDKTMMIFKMQSRKDGNVYGLFLFATCEFESFATEEALWTAARSRGFSGPDRLIPVQDVLKNYWDFDSQWYFAPIPQTDKEKPAEVGHSALKGDA